MKRDRIVGARRGAALPLALIVLVVSSLLALGALTMSRQTFRAGRNALVEQRSFHVAEYGLNREISNWRRERNLPPPTGMEFGAIDSSRVYIAAGDTARVKITRLNRTTYLVVSDGRAAISSKQMDSRRSVSTFVRLAYPNINPLGAITTAGPLTITGAASADGRNTTPTTWSQTYCDGLPGGDKYAVAMPPDSTFNGLANLEGTLKVLRDPLAGDSNTYISYGTETWKSLASNADLRLPGGFNASPTPILNGTADCDRGSLNNWGEPYRTGTRVTQCETYFPIIFVDGDLEIEKDGRGQGILLVNGNFKIRGNFDWIGLIVVTKDIVKGNGTANIFGAVMSRSAEIGAGMIAGNQDIKYSKCALETVMRGSAILTRVVERPWTQIY